MKRPKQPPSAEFTPVHGYEDEIDLREVVQTLRRHRWRLILPSVTLAMFAFIVSVLMPKQYQATAYLRIHKPIANDLIETPSVPEVLTIARSPEVLLRLVENPAVRGMYYNVERFSTEFLEKRVRIKGGQTKMLSLTYTDTSPERAAAMANLWAEAIISRLNEIYGTNVPLAQVERQLEVAWQEYENAQREYVASLQQDERPLLKARLQRAQNTLRCVLSRLEEAPDLQQNLRKAREKLADRPPEAELPLPLVMELLALQNRVLNFSMCSGSPPGPGFLLQEQAISVQEALRLLEELDTALQEQAQYLQAEEEQLAEQIWRLQYEIERAEAHIREVKDRRDKTWKIYQDLRQKQLYFASAQAAEWEVATLVVEAFPSRTPVLPNIRANTIVGFVVGLIFGFLWAFVPTLWSHEK